MVKLRIQWFGHDLHMNSNIPLRAERVEKAATEETKRGRRIKGRSEIMDTKDEQLCTLYNCNPIIYVTDILSS